ncbi:unnamed protein product, partial [Ectocarpus sp. 8 AP-2014]
FGIGSLIVVFDVTTLVNYVDASGLTSECGIVRGSAKTGQVLSVSRLSDAQLLFRYDSMSTTHTGFSGIEFLHLLGPTAGEPGDTSLLSTRTLDKQTFSTIQIDAGACLNPHKATYTQPHPTLSSKRTHMCQRFSLYGAAGPSMLFTQVQQGCHTRW